VSASTFVQPSSVGQVFGLSLSLSADTTPVKNRIVKVSRANIPPIRRVLAQFDEWLIEMSKKPFDEDTYLSGIKAFISKQRKELLDEVISKVKAREKINRDGADETKVGYHFMGNADEDLGIIEMLEELKKEGK